MQVIRAGRLIDGTGSAPRVDQAIYVADSRIADLRAVRRVIKGGRTLVRDGAVLE